MKPLYLILPWVLHCACGTPPSKYTINGNITQCDDNKFIYLHRVDPNLTLIDSAEIIDEKFVFTGNAQTKPYQCVLKFKGRFTSVATVYIEPGSISVTGQGYGAKATGTYNNDAQTEYDVKISPFYGELYSLNIRKSMTSDQAELDSLKIKFDVVETKLLSEQMSFLKKYSASECALSLVEYMSRTLNGEQIENIVAILDKSFENDPRVIALNMRAKQLRKCDVGMPAPDFKLSDQDGKEYALSDFRGKWLLIDFWASWCAPCRALLPDIANVVKKYADKPLVVMGISLDGDGAKWLKALKEEGCTWLQLRDHDGSTAKNFAVVAIPHMILIDPQGIIRAKNMRKELLDQILEQYVLN